MARQDETSTFIPTSKRERWTESQAHAVLDAWGRSGLTLAAFARQRGLGPQRLTWWRKRLSETSSRATSSPPVSSVPVTLRLAPALTLGAPVALTVVCGQSEEEKGTTKLTNARKTLPTAGPSLRGTQPSTAA